MPYKTVKELKSIAKELGLKGYSNLRRAEPIQMIEDHRRNSSSMIMGETVPELNVPILKPMRFTAKNNIATFKSLAGNISGKIFRNINKFADWLISYIPEPVRNRTSEKLKQPKNNVKQIFKNLERFEIKEIEPSLKGYLKTYSINGVKRYVPKKFISSIKPKVIDLIKQKKKPIKLKFLFTCTFQKENPANGKIDINTGYFHSLVETITESSDLSDIFNTMTGIILEKVQQFQNNGSGWQFKNIEMFEIYMDPLQSLVGSTYIILPKKLAAKKAIINVRNENDHECFKWALTSAVYPKEKDPQRLNNQMRLDSKNFNWDGIVFSVSLNQINKFERQNEYAVNVFGYDNEKVYPLRISKKESKVIDLLLVSNEKTNHYC